MAVSRNGKSPGWMCLGTLLVGFTTLSGTPLGFTKQWDRAAAEKAFEEARALHSEINASESGNPSRETYLRCIRTYQRVYLKDPHYGASDDAVFEAARLYQEMGVKFGGSLYFKNSTRLFRFLVESYPRSRTIAEALRRMVEIYSGPLADPILAQLAFDEVQSRFKSSQEAADAAAALNRSSLAKTEPKEVPESAAPSSVENLRHWSTSDYTRVVIDLDREAKYQKTQLTDPDRIYFDILNSRLSRDLINKTFLVGDAFLKQVRLGQNRSDVVRVVLDFASISDHTVFELHDPYRIIIDIHGSRTAQVKSDPSVSTKTAAEPDVISRSEGPKPQAESPLRTRPQGAGMDGVTPPPASGRTLGIREIEPATKLTATPRAPESTPPQPSPVSPTAGGRPAESSSTGARTRDIPSEPTMNPSPKPPDAAATRESAAAERPAAKKPELPGNIPRETAGISPKAAARTSRGDRTLTRVLGLKIGRIVLDPGHGGYDTGTIGKGGLMEKDLVLSVALELQKLLEDRLGAEVVLTRSEDTFVPLEERTAIANQHQADLFVSIHANSSHLRSISGVETYYLDFARTRDAQEVAARENASTVRNIRDLQELVKKITQADKSAESRELASIIQKKLYVGANKVYPSTRNRGVRSAPFVVLIGANMPSILTEVGFLSNPSDEKLLKKGTSTQRLAEALFSGIESYAKALGTTVAQNQSN